MCSYETVDCCIESLTTTWAVIRSVKDQTQEVTVRGRLMNISTMIYVSCWFRGYRAEQRGFASPCESFHHGCTWFFFFFLQLNEREACSRFDNRSTTRTVQSCLSKYCVPRLLNSRLLHDNMRQRFIHPEKSKNQQFLAPLKSLRGTVTDTTDGAASRLAFVMWKYCGFPPQILLIITD